MVDVRFHNFSGALPIDQLLEKAGFSELVPNSDLSNIKIFGANELQSAKPNEISLAASKKYAKQLAITKAACVIVHETVASDVPQGSLAIIAKDPHLVFVKILNILYPQGAYERIKRAKNAKGKKQVEKNVFIAEGAVLGENVEIGEGTYIGANAYIGDGVTIGRNCLIEDSCSIICSYIGDEVVIQSGARIGYEGFGWLDIAKSNIKIPQLGRVIIQDKVEIGANTTIDRGALGDTIIGEGTKIDNLVQIGHNCQIGRYCLIAATCGISGSTIIEDNCLLGGGAGTAGHLTIGAGTMVHGRSAVIKNWPKNSRIAGVPAQNFREYLRELAMLKRLLKKNRGKLGHE